MRRLFTFLLLALAILPASAMADVGDVTNDTVIALFRTGLSDEVIIAVVDRPRTEFDVKPEALIRLREEGLSNAMLETGNMDGRAVWLRIHDAVLELGRALRALLRER